jgi:hypothetical protein
MKSDSDALLSVCTAIEQETAALYSYFSELFHETPELARMLKKIMVEKENHVMQLQLAAKLEQRCEVDAHINIDMAQQLLNLVTGLQARVREFPPTWRNALKFAIELENKLSLFYADNALVFTEESFNSLYMAMKGHDEDQITVMTHYLALTV